MCVWSDALTAHKPARQPMDGRATPLMFATRHPTFWGPYPQRTPPPHPARLAPIHDLDANSHDRRHQPHIFPAYSSRELPPAVGAKPVLGGLSVAHTASEPSRR